MAASSKASQSQFQWCVNRAVASNKQHSSGDKPKTELSSLVIYLQPLPTRPGVEIAHLPYQVPVWLDQQATRAPQASPGLAGRMVERAENEVAHQYSRHWKCTELGSKVGMQNRETIWSIVDHFNVDSCCSNVERKKRGQ